MPHLSIEHSANLESRTDLGALCERLLDTILETGLFEVGAVRVRTIRCDHCAIADRKPENSFLDLNFRIGVGRSPDEKKRAGEALFAAAQQMLGPLFEDRNFALSLEIREIDPELSWKRNSMHQRLRKPNT